MKILTVADIVAATEMAVALPRLSEALGAESGVRVRKIGRAEYLALLPMLPPEAMTWPLAEVAQREAAWLATLSPVQLELRRQQARDVLYRVAVLACIEPVMTLDVARHLGDDVADLATEVLKFSGLVPTPKDDPVVDPVREPEAALVAA